MIHQKEKHINNELNHKLLQSVVAEANDAVLITKAVPFKSPRGPEIIYVNRRFEEMTGYKAEEVIGKTPRILQGPNTESEQLQKLRKAVKNRESVNVELINYSKNGEEYWINISLSPIFEEDQCTHFISIQRDITERKLREFKEALSSKISQIFNKSDSVKNALDSSLAEIIELKNFDAVEFWITDKDKESINLLSHKINNPEISDVYLKTKHFETLKKGEGLPGLTWKEQKRLFWRDLDKRREFIRNEVTTNKKLKTGVSFPVINGDEFEGVLVLLLSEDLKTEPYYVSLFEEVSLLLASEISRKKLEEQLKRIFSLSPDIICLASHEGYFKKINPAMIDLLGYSEEELLSQPYIQFVHPEDINATVEVKESLVRGNPVHLFKNRYITKSGNIKWISWISTPYSGEEMVLAIGRDITEQKALEELLDQANQLAKIGSWEVDLINHRIYWSDITKEIHEVEKDFVPNLEERIDFYKEGEHRRKIREAVERSIHVGESWDLELVLITAKGNERWVRAIGETEMVDGKPVRIYGSLQDIHSRKTAELKLQDRNRHIDAIANLNSSLLNYENWFEALGNHMELIGEAVKADRVYYFENRYDPDSGEGFTSQKLEWCREGITPQMDSPDLQEIPFKEVPELVDPMIEKRPSSESISSIAPGTTTRYVMEDQDIKTFLAIPITIKGKFFGFVGFDNCTAEVKWSEEEIRTLTTITSNLAVAIERSQVDNKIHEKTRQLDAIAHFNGLLIKEEGWQEALEKSLEKFCKVAAADRVYFFEYTFLEEAGQDVVTMKMEWVRTGVKPEIDNPAHKNLPVDEIRGFIDQVIYDGGYNEVVSSIKDNEFSAFLAEQDIKSILAIPVFTGKEFRGFMGFDDCTNERSWSEEEIMFLKTIAINLGSAIENEDSEKRLIQLNQSLEKQAKELASSNSELEQFAFVASHDLQEPLRMITSFLSQIERKYADILDEKGKKYIHFAVDGAMRMRQIIQDLLEYSRVGRVDVMREEVDLNTILENVKILQMKVIEEKKADVTWEPMPIVRANRGAMQHIFQNLIQNGLNYSKEGIQPELKIWSEENKNCWKFFVKDNGIGIDSQYRDQIFVIFQRLHAKEEYKGTGVGLAICKKIVENHGGKIGVDSEIGNGSTFYFTIEKSQLSL